MRKIPDILAKEMRREMGARKIPRAEQVAWFKWLRDYLDFCFKYQHSTRDPETEVLYCINLRIGLASSVHSR